MSSDAVSSSIRQQMIIGLGVTVLCGLIAIALVLAAFSEPLLARLNGEVDLMGNAIYQPPFEVDGAVIDGIDFSRVHGELLPNWMIAQSRASKGGSRPTADGQLEALVAEAGRDENLAVLLNDLAALVREDPWENAEAIEHKVWSWNVYMERIGAPFWIDGTVMSQSGQASFYTKSYAVHSDMKVTVAGRPYRQRIIRRIDRTNVVEMYHGKATTVEEGAFVLVDRLAEFAVNEVWPLLAADASDPFAAAVRTEVLAALPAEHGQLLAQTAPVRARLNGAVTGIRGRRKCSRFVISSLPWSGLDPGEHSRIQQYAERSRGERCPEVTMDEAAGLIESSNALAANRRIEPALEALVALLARGTAVHEARHVADVDAVGQEQVLPCAECDAELPWRDARAELSAYLASFADPETGVVSLFQACGAMEGGGGHGAAMEFALIELGDDVCAKGPPADLNQRAAALEQRWLGRSEPVDLTEAFPATLALTTASP